MTAENRITTTLAWASEYLQQERAEDAKQLLAEMNPQTLEQEQLAFDRL